MKKVEKPWGYELWIAYDNGRYAGKILHIRRGKRLSLQYHRRKHETIFLQRGILKLTMGKEGKRLKSRTLKKGEAAIIQPGTVHRMEALAPCDVLEFSSPELEDVVRLEDDYGRIGP